MATATRTLNALGTSSLDKALKQLRQASGNLDNGQSSDWRGRASVLIARIALAIQFPGQYEIAHLAKELEDALAKLPSTRHV